MVTPQEMYTQMLHDSVYLRGGSINQEDIQQFKDELKIYRDKELYRQIYNEGISVPIINDMFVKPQDRDGTENDQQLEPYKYITISSDEYKKYYEGDMKIMKGNVKDFPNPQDWKNYDNLHPESVPAPPPNHIPLEQPTFTSYKLIQPTIGNVVGSALQGGFLTKEGLKQFKEDMKEHERQELKKLLDFEGIIVTVQNDKYVQPQDRTGNETSQQLQPYIEAEIMGSDDYSSYYENDLQPRIESTKGLPKFTNTPDIKDKSKGKSKGKSKTKITQVVPALEVKPFPPRVSEPILSEHIVTEAQNVLSDIRSMFESNPVGGLNESKESKLEEIKDLYDSIEKILIDDLIDIEEIEEINDSYTLYFDKLQEIVSKDVIDDDEIQELASLIVKDKDINIERKNNLIKAITTELEKSNKIFKKKIPQVIPALTLKQPSTLKTLVIPKFPTFKKNNPQPEDEPIKPAPIERRRIGRPKNPIIRHVIPGMSSAVKF